MAETEAEMWESRSSKPEPARALPGPEVRLAFVPYGLARWPGIRVLERESHRGEVPKEIALGHGLRWSDAAWVEVATFHPDDTASAMPNEHWTLKIQARLESEAEERAHSQRSRDIPAGEPVLCVDTSLIADGQRVSAETWRLGELRCCAFSASVGSLVMVTWIGEWPRDARDLVPITDLTEYRVGLQTDLPRRINR